MPIRRLQTQCKMTGAMKLEVHLAGKARQVELTRSEGRLTCAIDGQPIDADAVEIEP